MVCLPLASCLTNSLTFLDSTKSCLYMLSMASSFCYSRLYWLSWDTSDSLLSPSASIISYDPTIYLSLFLLCFCSLAFWLLWACLEDPPLRELGLREDLLSSDLVTDLPCFLLIYSSLRSRCSIRLFTLLTRWLKACYCWLSCFCILSKFCIRCRNLGSSCWVSFASPA